MDFKKTKAPNSIVTRDMNDLSSNVGNVYETVNIIAKRANQINHELKEELGKKLQEYGSLTDNLEEMFNYLETREEIRSVKELKDG
jgi:DNA-directed RNA polymerase subunit K/omega